MPHILFRGESWHSGILHSPKELEKELDEQLQTPAKEVPASALKKIRQCQLERQRLSGFGSNFTCEESCFWMFLGKADLILFPFLL